MRSKPMFERTRLAVITLVVLCVAAVGIWTLVVGSTAMGSPAAEPGASAPAGSPASVLNYAPASSHSPDTPLCDPNWVVVTSPNVGTYNNIFYGVAAESASDVWAVGYYSNGTVNRTLVEHWNGSVWVVAFSPNVGTYDSYLYAVSAASASDAWAAGYYNNGTAYQTLIEHWNGTQWTIVNSPNVGTDNNLFRGVAAISSSDAWAVGTYRTGGVRQTLAEHWNGSVWAIVFSPNVGTGDNLFLAISAVSSGDVWAVGDYVGTVYQTLTEHWDGTQWTIVNSPGGGINETDLLGVAAISSSDVWAVGDISSNAGYRTLTEHWNGSVWAIVPSPNGFTYQNYLTAVSAKTTGDVWAVGDYTDNMGDHTLVEHWNGTQWSVISSPSPGTSSNYLYGVAAVSSGDVWAVGDYAGPVYQTLAERYNPCTPTSTPTPAATPTPTSCPIQYTDVPQGSTFYPYIRCLACRGIINGYADGTFKPNNQVTRGQLSKIVSNSAGFNDPQPTRTFQDVPLGSTFQIFIGRLASRGYISGYPCGGVGEPCAPPANLPYFRPGNNATRGQISKIVSNAAGFSDPPAGQQFEDVAVGSAFYTYTYRLVSRSVMSGYPCGGAGEPCIPPGNLPYFRPNNNATRGQTSKIVSNTFLPDCQTPARK